jgi:hypothetical protein
VKLASCLSMGCEYNNKPHRYPLAASAQADVAPGGYPAVGAVGAEGVETKLWVIPASRMKADAPNAVPLSDAAIEVLQGLLRFRKGDFLFSTDFGKRSVARGRSMASARRSCASIG